jgi:glycine cleavage system aminomethyltransferase T
MLSPALTKPGTRVQFRDDRGVLHAAVVVEPPFYDPDNLRQRMEAA